jgi:hypothetical protein
MPRLPPSLKLRRALRWWPRRSLGGDGKRGMTSEDITSRSRHALRPSFASKLLLFDRQRAQGRPGAGRTHGPPATKKAGGSYHRLGRTTGLPCAMALTLIPCSPRGPGCFAPVARNALGATCELDLSVGRPRPHGFAYATASLVSRRRRVHRIPGPTFVTIAKRPSCGPGWRRDGMVFRKTEENFSREAG